MSGLALDDRSVSQPHRFKYEDPHSDEYGLLLSHRIQELCDQHLLIREEYDPDQLRPASYTLKVGADFQDSDGKRSQLTPANPSFLFPKNSIVWVSSAEVLDLPYYVVARFNIRVSWVYEGILLGTGPQVDPGFVGRLSCPLYNLTNSDLVITLNEPFATIDFEKTTPLPKAIVQWLSEGNTRSLPGEGGLPHKFFTQRPMLPLEKRAKHEVTSSLKELRDEIRAWRVIGFAVLLSFFALCLTLLQFTGTVFRENQAASARTIEEVRRTTAADTKVQALEGRLQLLEGALARSAAASAPLPIPTDTPPSPAPPQRSARPR